MDSLLTRAGLVAAAVLLGIVAKPPSSSPFNVTGPLLGAVGAAAILGLERLLRRPALSTLLGGLIGLLLGGGVAAATLAMLPLENLGWLPAPLARGLVILLCTYVGVVQGAARGHRLSPRSLRAAWTQDGTRQQCRILDTSAIIDGRIADVTETGFLDGTLVVPQFVLRELQHIADSQDPMKRNRGRKGLEILQRIKKGHEVHVLISETDFPEIKEVDLKLIELAKQLSGKIITNDFNLNKVAELRGVQVLNVNMLANSLKPVVLPGEPMKVFILKEGKEPNQGVGYLDDGTMVVVDNAKRFLGRNIEITVTSVLQTTAGKMFFGKSDTLEDAAAIDHRPRRTGL